ncbi:MAG: protein jag, partial [Sulfurovum sp.]|nr:protein jag [Sulfurovum sp.]
EEDTAAEILTAVKEEYSVEKCDEEDYPLEIEENIIYDELALLIENELKELFSHACFDIDIIEVDVRDNTALIFIDGEDAALLIGKEGYRYNALAYMLFTWLHTKYELFIKLEIAEFLTKQQEMIRASIKPVIETVENTGRAKTHFLDGILVQIALEQLREVFPDKYVAIKTTKNGKKFVVINEFNTKNNG